MLLRVGKLKSTRQYNQRQVICALLQVVLRKPVYPEVSERNAHLKILVDVAIKKQSGFDVFEQVVMFDGSCRQIRQLHFDLVHGPPSFILNCNEHSLIGYGSQRSFYFCGEVLLGLSRRNHTVHILWLNWKSWDGSRRVLPPSIVILRVVKVYVIVGVPVRS